MFSPLEQVDPGNPLHTVMLTNLQANILKHHGRSFAWHLFIQFNAQKAGDIKKWLGRFSCTITNARKQLEDAAFHKTNKEYDGGMICCFFLTKQGYNKLGITAIPKDQAFNDGLANRQAEKLFKADYKDWDDKFKDIDAMILLADMDENNLQQAYDDIQLQTHALFTKTGVQKGEVLVNEHNIGIEHFGYADGVSQPSFIKGAVKPGKTWNDNCIPDILLVPETVAGNEDCYGSYFVFLKLEQNVELFKKAEDRLGDSLKEQVPVDDREHFDEEIAGAYLVGRFEPGNPVVKNNQEKEISSDKQFDNDFDYRYDKEGTRCPFHAHIRLTNPRNGGTTHTAARIARRGIPYDEAGRNGDLTWHPTKDVGLLFMCYQASIAGQFEAIQKAANTGLGKFGIDAVIGQETNAAIQQQQVPRIYNEAGMMQLEGDNRITGFVTMKGGEYFYAPSIPFLRNLG
jgi:Dyp-type peroxidase family